MQFRISRKISDYAMTVAILSFSLMLLPYCHNVL